MAAAARSALHIGGWIGELMMLVGTSLAAALGHVLIVVGIFLFSLVPMCNITPPVDDNVIEVSLVSLAKSDTAMAQMDVAVASAKAPVDVDAPAPEKDPGLTEQGTSEPPPETASDLAFQTPDAKEAQGDPDRERAEAREEAMNRLRRENMLKALGSAESTAGDPDSTSSESINLGGTGVADPELARYRMRVETIFGQNFNPIPTLVQQNPDIRGVVNVRADLSTGRVQSWAWKSRSGNASWDAACERAIEAMPSIPAPPAKYHAYFADGYDFVCKAK